MSRYKNPDGELEAILRNAIMVQDRLLWLAQARRLIEGNTRYYAFLRTDHTGQVWTEADQAEDEYASDAHSVICRTIAGQMAQRYQDVFCEHTVGGCSWLISALESAICDYDYRDCADQICDLAQQAIQELAENENCVLV